jgi:hypothetical protein
MPRTGNAFQRLLAMALVAALGLSAGRTLVAQELASAAFAHWPAPLAAPQAPTLALDHSLPLKGAVPADPVMLTMAGLVGSAAGVFGGGYLGYQIDRQSEDVCDYCGLTGLLLGAAVGSAVLTPLAVHAANGGRGDLGDALVASSVITGAGMVLTIMTNSGEVLIAVPIAAIIGSVVTERATTR